MDINKVWLSGLVVSRPILTKLSSRTPFTSFMLQVNEYFNDRNGNEKYKSNLIKIESLGKSAEVTANKVKRGQRYQVDGYIRQDTVDDRPEVKVRAFAIYKEDSKDSAHYNSGLKEALRVLENSRDLGAAIGSIQDILASEITGMS